MSDQDKVYWSSLLHREWALYVVATVRGLCCVTFPGQSFEDIVHFTERYFPKATLEENEEFMDPYVSELKDCLEGRCVTTTVPLDLHGTPFQVSVWKAISTIPYARTMTYSGIAKLIGKPAAVRAVGAATGANPIAFLVPCHRVLGKNGDLTGYRGGLDVKSRLLKWESEGQHATEMVPRPAVSTKL